MKIQKLSAKRFRGIVDSEIEFGKGLNILVGPNNCGKSSILAGLYIAFQFLQANNGASGWKKKGNRLKGVTLRDPLIPIPDLSYLSNNLKKSSHAQDRIELEIVTDIESFVAWATFSGYNMNVYASKEMNKEVSKNCVDKFKKILKQSPTFIPLFSGVIASEEHKTDRVTEYYSKTGKASEILRNKFLQLQINYPQRLEKVKKYIKSKFNLDFTNSIVDELGVHVRTHYVENNEHPKKDEDFDISALGSGFQQILHLLLYIFSEDTDIILIDEPDAHLHRSMQRILFELLYEISEKENKQIIIATHSFEFIQLSMKYQDAKLFLIDKTMPKQKPIKEYNEFLRDLYLQGIINENDLKNNSTRFLVCEDKNEGREIYESFLNLFNPEWKIKGYPFIFISGQGSGGNERHYHSLLLKAVEDTSLKAIILNDNDGLEEGYFSKVEEKKTKGQVLWKYLPVFEAENLLLNLTIIKKAIEKKYSDKDELNLFKIDKEYLKGIIRTVSSDDDIKSHFRQSAGDKIKKYYNEIGVTYGDSQSISEKLQKEIYKLSFDDMLNKIPGKEVLGGLLRKLQEERGININYKDILNSFTKNDVPTWFFQMIEDLMQ